ncbi:uncharacterized protein LOC143981516 [Lithobates pipiens]
MSGKSLWCVAGLLYMMIIPVSSGTVYVQSGSDITDCNMKCPEDNEEVTLELFRVCRGVDRTLLENHCYYNTTKTHDSRLRLHTGSGCWKLTHARREDSGVYKIWCYCAPGYVMSSTEIRVLDPVLISNITSNCSRLGEEVAVSVQFSGEESAVTWEVDGEPIPERYRLIDDNRTLIIPSVQRDDAERRFRVRITNPVSEEIREYQLILDPIFRKLQKTEDSYSYVRHRPMVCLSVPVILVALIVIIYLSAFMSADPELDDSPNPANLLPAVQPDAPVFAAQPEVSWPLPSLKFCFLVAQPEVSCPLPSLNFCARYPA